MKRMSHFPNIGGRKNRKRCCCKCGGSGYNGRIPAVVDLTVFHDNFQINFLFNNTYHPHGQYDFVIDCGDGTTETGTFNTNNSFPISSIQHIYQNSGTYRIKVFCEYMPFIAGSDTELYTDIVDFGSPCWVRLNCSTYTRSVPKIPQLGNYTAAKLSGWLTTYLWWTEVFDTIPKGLLDSAINMESYGSAFMASHIHEIPVGLFDHSQNARDFSQCLRSTTELKAVPDRLFYHNKLATNFNGCFAYSGIESTSADMFPESASVFIECFQFSNINTIHPDTFAQCKNITSFRGAFRYCNDLKHAPPLWEMFPDAISTDCFEGCYNADNFSNIPISWK